MASWYVLKIGGNAPSYKHQTFEAAVAEAKRLADRIGGQYEILRIEAAVRPADRHVVDDYRSDKYPF